MPVTHIITQIENCANILKSLHQQGISAIPLQGKAPHYSIKWKRYQNELPSHDDLDTWIQYNSQSYGIICGRISHGIVVLDFDCVDLYHAFVTQFSTISQSYTVKTRRGYHVYLRTRFPTPSRKFENCDIKADGGYVVGVGSIIGNYTYHVAKDADIRLIQYKDYGSLLQWLCPKQAETVKFSSLEDTSHFDIQAQYRSLARDTGRNNALFTVACQARNRGVAQDTLIDSLAVTHSIMPTQQTHRDESRQMRYKEAVNTIHSAYSQPRRSIQSKSLSNSIREKLLQQQGSTIVPRLLDVLQQLKPNTLVTARQLIQIARTIRISKQSLIRVLTGDLAKIYGKRIFKQFLYSDKIESYASQGDNRKPNSRVGRPTQYIYQIPSMARLCKLLNVEAGVSDSLKQGDLCSAGAYRRALHRELIRRLSPMIRVAWYANRLGVHRRTIFRYNNQLGVETTPMIEQQPLTMQMIQTLPDNNTTEVNGFTPGMWLQTDQGMRYPALRTIAVKFLIGPKVSVRLCKQLPSRYKLPYEQGTESYPLPLPDHLRSRGKLLTYTNVHKVLAPDWATKKFELGGYLAVYNGLEWTFRPPFRAIAYQLVKKYEEGLVYFIYPLKT